MMSAHSEFMVSVPALINSKRVQDQSPYRLRSSNVNQVTHGNDDLITTSCSLKRRCQCYDLHKQLVPYMEAWSWQKSIVRERHKLLESGEDHSDILIVLQHPPVYTLGTASSNEYLNFDVKDAPYDVYRTERGGEVTYHGPGQLVIYPILNLRFHKMDLHWYLRSLEEVIIRVLSSKFSIKASRLKGFTGVWVGNQKLAAIGIRVSRWITFHGVALNVTTDLSPFKHIVPCGIRDRGVGSLKELLGSSWDRRKDDSLLLDVTREYLIKEFSDVFQLQLCREPLDVLDLVGSCQSEAFES